MARFYSAIMAGNLTGVDTEGFEAALLTDVNKSNGAILVAKGRSRQRRRYSIGHELGHFLIPTHVPGVGGEMLCSLSDLATFDPNEQDKRRRMEAEANQFAALLLMPPPVLRSELAKSGAPDLTRFVALADLFDVSKQAMARSYVSYHREAVAIIRIRDGRVIGTYREPRKFPWIELRRDKAIPQDSIAHGPNPGSISNVRECHPELWLSADDARKVGAMTEQVLWQQDGYAMIMLHADMVDEDDEPADRGRYRTW